SPLATIPRPMAKAPAGSGFPACSSAAASAQISPRWHSCWRASACRHTCRAEDWGRRPHRRKAPAERASLFARERIHDFLWPRLMASRVAPLVATYPLWALLFGALLLPGQTVTLQYALGSALTVSGAVGPLLAR